MKREDTLFQTRQNGLWCIAFYTALTPRNNRNIITGHEALTIAGLTPITLAPKEGIALFNGTQVSTALRLKAYFKVKIYFHQEQYAVPCQLMRL